MRRQWPEPVNYSIKTLKDCRTVPPSVQTHTGMHTHPTGIMQHAQTEQLLKRNSAC